MLTTIELGLESKVAARVSLAEGLVQLQKYALEKAPLPGRLSRFSYAVPALKDSVRDKDRASYYQKRQYIQGRASDNIPYGVSTRFPYPDTLMEKVDEEGVESPILTMLEPSTAKHPSFKLSFYALALLSHAQVMRYLMENDLPVEAGLAFKTKIDHFYHECVILRHEVKRLDGSLERLILTLPTHPYFSGQVLVATHTGRPAFAEMAADFSDVDLETSLTLIAAIEQKVRAAALAYPLRQSVNDIEMIACLLNQLPPHYLIAQNSPHAITDAAYPHWQLFDTDEIGKWPLFFCSAKINVAVDKPDAWTLFYLDPEIYPALVFAVAFAQGMLTSREIAFLIALQNQFIKRMESPEMRPEDKAEMALMGRKTPEAYQFYYVLRKDLAESINYPLVKATAQEVLLPEDTATGAPAIYHKRPGFIEFSGSFLAADERVYDRLSDEKITAFLRTYRATPKALEVMLEETRLLLPSCGM